MIHPKDIESCEVVGKLNGSDVKLLKTKGGFHMFIGKKDKQGGDIVLAGASHKAIGMYKMGKDYSGFQPNLQKSESDALPSVTEIPNDSKYELYTLEKGEFKAISACRCGLEVMSVLLKNEDGAYYTHSIDVELAKKLPQEEKDLLATIMAKAMVNV